MGVLDKFLDIMKLSDDDEYDEDDFFDDDEEDSEDEEAEAALERCDEIFREREDEINSILNAYAAALDR